MLDVMKKLLIAGLLSSAFICSFTVHAVLYKGVDAEGNVVYSDKPFVDAERYTPPPISVMDAPRAVSEKKEKSEEKPAEFKYTKFNITSPANNETLRDEAFVNVTLELKPGLNAAEDHSIWLTMDGKTLVKNSKSLNLQLDNIERGAHQIQALIKDSSGKRVLRTQTVIFHMQRTSVR